MHLYFDAYANYIFLFTYSENRFYPPSHPSLLANAFENLTTLSLNQTGITWKEVILYKEHVQYVQ